MLYFIGLLCFSGRYTPDIWPPLTYGVMGVKKGLRACLFLMNAQKKAQVWANGVMSDKDQIHMFSGYM